jgi:hypothetical protein
LGPYHRHAIGTFNTCSRGSIERSLIDTGGSYNLEDVGLPHAHSPTNSRKFLLVEIEGKSLKNLETLDFNEIWPASFWLHLITRKNQFPSKEYQQFEFHLKGNLD